MKLRYGSYWDNKVYEDEFKVFLKFKKAHDYASKCFDILRGTLEFQCLNCNKWTKKAFSGGLNLIPVRKRKIVMFYCRKCQLKEIRKYKDDKKD
jgi:hypothetical protein